MLLPHELPPTKTVHKIARLRSVDLAPAFHLPSALNADRPPERRGLARDGLHLLVLDRCTGNVTHTSFDRIAEYFEPGDLLVFNSSRTLPAKLVGMIKDSPSKIDTRSAELLPDGTWLGLLLPEAGTEAGNLPGKAAILDFGGGLHCQVLEQDQRIPRLWKLQFSKSGTEFLDLVYRIGQPARYGYLSAPWRLGYYQNVYALQPGAVEMPSAGRAFSWRLLLQLRNRGVETAFITLNTGLSSYLDDEIDRQHLASEEEYWISEDAATKIRRAKNSGRRCGRSGRLLYGPWSPSPQTPVAKYAPVTSTPNCTSPPNIAYGLSMVFSPDYTNQKPAISTCWPRSSGQR